MKGAIIRGIIICAGLLIAYSCIDPYNPSTTSEDPSYLVVDGFLNSSTNSCTIKLTHTVPLNKDGGFVPNVEANATVQIEDDGGLSFVLSEVNSGEYSAANLTLDLTRKYRLKIITKNKKQYLSEFVPIVQTPQIDSLTYGNERNGVYINVNTHDPDNKTRYYLWTYTETWNYEAAFASEFEFIPGTTTATYRPVSFFNCYRSVNSSDLLLSSSAKLNVDIISQFTLTVIPWQSPKLKKKYSILAQQRSLTKDGYEYFEQLKKNTENLGTLFGPLPSTIVGNIQCITDTQEPVIGYFTAGSQSEKRIFIAAQQIKRPSNVPDFDTGYAACEQDSAFFKNGPVEGPLVTPIYEGFTIIGWTTSSLSCVDCRFKGGTIVKPDFWQ